MSEEEKVDLFAPPQEEEEKKEEEQEIQKEVEKEESKEKTLNDVLSAFEDAPDEAQIEKWKKEYGEVLCTGFSDEELFVFRPLTRAEHVNLQLNVARLQEQGKPVTSYDVEEQVVETCTLWASPPGAESLERKAGSLSTLYEQVMQQSNFVNPAVAAQYVIKL